MHILIVHARVKTEYIDAFKEATIVNAQNSAKEAGVARFDFMQQKDDPSKFVLYEVYKDEQAPVKHKESAHYNEWLAKVEHMFAEPRTRAFYANVFPGDEGY